MHRADGLAGLERYVDGEAPVALADHLWWSPTRGTLSASRAVNWYSWKEQVCSLEKLLDFGFRWVLPGHGRRYRAESPAAMRRELERGRRRLRAV